ncbi:hypothetical protein D3C75_698480 [compost metagenome]
MKTCIICGTEFQAPPSAATVTCGPECSVENRRRLAASGVNDDALQKAHAAIPNSPLTGRFETHVNAKEWVIVSPVGQEFRCRNLMLWLREHEDLLDGTPKQAFDGFARMKQTALGRRKKGLVYQWKGWKLKSWSE